MSTIITVPTLSASDVNLSLPAEFPALTSVTGFHAVAEPVYMHLPKSLSKPERFEKIPSHVGRVVRRTDTGQTLGIVGSRYQIAQNQAIYAMICNAAKDSLPESALGEVKLSEHSSFDGQYTRFELTFPNLGAEITQLEKPQTKVNFRIGVSNTFDGSSSVRVLAGAYDVLCTNGMIIDETEIKTARHTSGYTPEIFSGLISVWHAKYKEWVSVWNKWAESKIEEQKAEAALRAARMSRKRREAIMNRFQIEAKERGSTVWALYSALTYYASHNSEEFAVGKSRKGDNVALALGAREREISQVISLDAWENLAA